MWFYVQLATPQYRGAQSNIQTLLNFPVINGARLLAYVTSQFPLVDVAGMCNNIPVVTS